ncbi:putative ubiquitin regulatory protein (ISS) [Trypanosoma rangeli]|uniref:Putative ubiquitin regulatory protein (ISS) n=1 Tax=Trypanosoma rangeli TaxID=5698 RepID=A0A3S5IQV7_TRYRA|nr:putative ubiquitin regulatory protein (ISS) [Trypanosoma rangeli]RNF02660.1 putative ubiquitin regulatory protein (ISS) [Trypanosoma rangeli]|eukprot:RNF02660.1 putative ubiquitin regulatory protein (ISS) [Trypanosoma rangeli]
MSGQGEQSPGAWGTSAEMCSSSSSSFSVPPEGSKTHCISQTLFETLQEKGFSENAIKKSIVAGCVDAGTCTQWITMHEGHPELDTPLEDGVEVVVKGKRVLTEAEREKKVRELREKAKANIAEEKRAAIEKERERIAMGRKAIETQEMLEKLRRESELAEVRKQKEADRIAKRRVKVQILADKYVRQGNTKEEAFRMAELEFEEAAQKRRQENVQVESKGVENVRGSAPSTASWDIEGLIAQNTSLSDVFNTPPAPLSLLPRLVDGVRNHEDAAMAHQCLAVLLTILRNIRENPFDAKKRSLKTTTGAFRMRIGPVPSAIQLLRTCGFQLATDENGNESIILTTVVLRVIERAIALLSQET